MTDRDLAAKTKSMPGSPARTSHLGKDGQPLSVSECQRRLMRLKFEHPRFKAVVKRFEHFELMAEHALEGISLAVPGRSGMGKTLLIKHLRKTVMARESLQRGLDTIDGKVLLGPDGDLRPILRIELLPQVTTIGLAETLLKALGDENPLSGTRAQKMGRVREKLQQQAVRVVLVDETQHFTDKRTDQAGYAAAEWFKSLMNEADGSPESDGSRGDYFMHAVFFGTPAMLKLFTGNGQLSRRNKGGIHRFRPWGWMNENERAEYKLVLAKLDRMLPFPESSRLADETMALRIHRATDAVISRITTLMQHAGTIALSEGSSRIDDDMLCDAFDQLGWDLGTDDFAARSNPWRDKELVPGWEDAPAAAYDNSRVTRMRGRVRNDDPTYEK